jgi:hypothetical protein
VVRTAKWSLLLGMVLTWAAGARADAAFLLGEPYGSYGAMNPTGHAAVYLSRICADSPTVLRRCFPGEEGAVIARYHDIAGYTWLAIPLLPYLYAVEERSAIPSFADDRLIAELRDQYRRGHLEEVAPDDPEGGAPGGEWPQLVGAAYDRKIYGYLIRTSEAQDDELIRHFNERQKQAHVNVVLHLLFHNCADFSRIVLDFYYPGSVHRSFLADGGITTPKQIAKSLYNYGKHHPEVELSPFVIPQVPGTRARSKPVHGVVESLLRSKKYVVPLALFHPYATGALAATYLAVGRFNPARHASTVAASREAQAPIVALLQPSVQPSGGAGAPHGQAPVAGAPGVAAAAR